METALNLKYREILQRDVMSQSFIIVETGDGLRQENRSCFLSWIILWGVVMECFYILQSKLVEKQFSGTVNIAAQMNHRKTYTAFGMQL